MALPKKLRLKGHRAFNYIHKNSKKYYGQFMDLRIAKSCPRILLSHKVSKRSVVRNKIRRKLQEDFLKDFKEEYNHIPYWVLVNLKSGSFYNYETELLNEFQTLFYKTGLLK